MLELLSPAGSPESVSAAVQNGADAVYLSFESAYPASGHNLTEDEFGRAAEFCRIRGVKVYACLSSLPSDKDFAEAIENAKRACRMGADAVIADDLGLIWALRRAVPSMPIHAGVNLNIHNVDGVNIAAAMGVKRVVLSPELTREDIENICRNSPVETEICVHGPICASYPGLCLLSAASGDRSRSDSICSRSCLSGFAPQGHGKHPLSIKDSCLVDHIKFLSECGVTAVRIDGRDRRPEYTAAVTGVYTRAIHNGSISPEDRRMLADAFPSDGFTDAALTGRHGPDMLGDPGKESTEDSPFYSDRRKEYLNREFQRVNVSFTGSVSLGGPLKLTVTDDRGNSVSGEAGVAELAFHQELSLPFLQTELCKTGGTPFLCSDVHCDIERGIYLSPSVIGPLRDDLLKQLIEKRAHLEPRAEGDYAQIPHISNPGQTPVLTVSVQKCSQLSSKLFELSPPVVYVPLDEAVSGSQELEPFLRSENISVCAVLPPVIYDREMGSIANMLLKAKQLGINEVACGNIGHIIFARKMGFEVRGDLSLNICNSYTLAAMGGFHMKSAILSPVLGLDGIGSIPKAMDTELMIYGRMPLMYTAGCVAKNLSGICSCDSFKGLSDKDGLLCPITHGFSCRNTVWSPRKLFLASRSREYLSAGLWGVRLCFSTETAAECVSVTERYLEMNNYEPASYTTSLF